jgi:hypothetical protein
VSAISTVPPILDIRHLDPPTTPAMTVIDPFTQPPEPLVQRVRKLLDKAERTDNVHESEAFARKAAELVAEHRISPDQLAAGERRSDDLRIVEIMIGRGAYVRARLALLAEIAAAHDVRVIFQSTPVGTVAFAAGHHTDLEIVEMLYSSLHQQAASHMASVKRSTGAATQRYRRSFLFGFAGRIGEILAESRRTVEASVGVTTAAANAVMLRERAERVADFVDREWGSVRSASRPRPVQPSGYVSGAAAAERADLGRVRLGGRRSIGRGS